MNSSLFPDVDPESATWTGPPPGIVASQSLLYASLTTSLIAAILAMLGKQWVNRYLRNRGGSAVDKSRDRQRKLDGLEKWHFRLVIESLPVMLQIALLLFAGALSRYLWTISRAVAGVVIAATLFGVASYVFFTLAAALYHNCPYQTPPSILIRNLIGYLVRGNDTLARSLRSLVAPFPPVENIRRTIRRLSAGVHSGLENLGCLPSVQGEIEHIPLAVVTPPARIFEDVFIDWDVFKADIRCISWILYSTTDIDVIYSTVRFTGDVIWYPEITGALSPRILVDLFFDCLLDGRVVPGNSEHASSIGMALASILSVRLAIEPENEELGELCERIRDDVEWALSSEPTLVLVVGILRFVARTPTRVRGSTLAHQKLSKSIPDHLSTPQKLWLSRIILQTLW